MELQSLAGVRAIERLIQYKDGRIMDKGGGEPHALPHSARVGGEAAVLRVRHPDGLNGLVDCLGDVREAVHTGGELNEFTPRVEIVDGLMFRHDADPAVEFRVAADRLSEDAHLAARCSGEAGHHVEEGCLARAVGAEQAGDAGANFERDLIDSDDIAEPLGDVVDDDGGVRAGFNPVVHCGLIGAHATYLRYRHHISARGMSTHMR